MVNPEKIDGGSGSRTNLPIYNHSYCQVEANRTNLKNLISYKIKIFVLAILMVKLTGGLTPSSQLVDYSVLFIFRRICFSIRMGIEFKKVSKWIF